MDRIGRVLDWCHNQLIEGSKQGQRAHTSIARLEDVICTIRELGPQAATTKLDVGSRHAPRKLQVQAPICALQKLDIGPIDNTQGCRLGQEVGHEVDIKLCPVVGAETSTVESGTASTNPSCASQKKPSQSVPGYLKKSRNSRRRARRQRDDDNQPPQKQHKPESALLSAGFTFGCPFYFRNNEDHQACLNLTLTRVGDVRQHIYRSHVLPSYCPRCGITFQDDIDYSQRDTHERQRICEVARDFRQYLGATSDQLASMTSVAAAQRSTCTDEERWYAIWRIMFPGIEDPPTPYIDNWRERNRIEVRTAIAQYLYTGGPQDFIHRMQVSPIVEGVLVHFLGHFGDYYNRATTFVSAAEPSSVRDTWSNDYMVTESRNPILTPTVSRSTQGPGMRGAILPILLPRIDSTHTGRTLPHLDPNRHPNTDDDSNLGHFDRDFSNS